MLFNHSFKKVLVAVLMVGAAIPVGAGKDIESSVVHPSLAKEENGVFGSKHIDEDNRFHPSLIKEEQENRDVSDRIAVPLKIGKIVIQEEARTTRITKAGKKTKTSKSASIRLPECCPI